MHINRMKCLLLVVFIGSGGFLHAGLPLESTGVRIGVPVNNDFSFRQTEMFADFNLPWRFELSANWIAQTRLDISAGVVGERGRYAFDGSVGSSVILRWKKFPVTFDLGFNPTYLSRHVFPSRNFGIPLQFTSHAGLDWNVGSHIRLGYRLQHMSNGGLGFPNPGLNLNVFTVSYRF